MLCKSHIEIEGQRVKEGAFYDCCINNPERPWRGNSFKFFESLIVTHNKDINIVFGGAECDYNDLCEQVNEFQKQSEYAKGFTIKITPPKKFSKSAEERLSALKKLLSDMQRDCPFTELQKEMSDCQSLGKIMDIESIINKKKQLLEERLEIDESEQINIQNQFDSVQREVLNKYSMRDFRNQIQKHDFETKLKMNADNLRKLFLAPLKCWINSIHNGKQLFIEEKIESLQTILKIKLVAMMNECYVEEVNKIYDTHQRFIQKHYGKVDYFQKYGPDNLPYLSLNFIDVKTLITSYTKSFLLYEKYNQWTDYVGVLESTWKIINTNIDKTEDIIRGWIEKFKNSWIKELDGVDVALEVIKGERDSINCSLESISAQNEQSRKLIEWLSAFQNQFKVIVYD